MGFCHWWLQHLVSSPLVFRFQVNLVRLFRGQVLWYLFTQEDASGHPKHP